MATPILPYPDMDFTPLDILTAEEMNQLVANQQYLKEFAAGLANGTNLENDVVKSLNKYTQNEQEIGEWIDEKTIYRKVVKMSEGLIGGGGDLTYSFPVSGEIIRLWGVARYSSGTDAHYRFIPDVGDGQSTSIRIIYQDQQIKIRTFSGSTWQGYDTVYAVIEYTKD